ncbi:MAG TPA: site-2 protease family protein [Anaerolineae bacterium]|nr:site-2 protease family protein [Anaerolineae bacterium]
MKGSLNLAKIFGIPIRLHTSWFLVAVLVTWTLAAGYFPTEYPGWPAATYWSVGLVTAVLFFASVLIHELGHSVLALREGVPVKSITLFIFGGVAEIGREPQTAGAEFRIAVAGPLASLGLAALFGGGGALLAENAALAAPLAYLGRINLLLVAFNMIPGFPLDGGRVLRAALWAFGGSFQNATKWASRAGRVVAYGFILFGVGQILVGGGLLNGLWIAFIGWFLNNAAESSYQQVRLRDTLSGVKARNVMTQECVTVPSGLGVDRLIEEHVLAGGQRCFFVGDSGSPEGMITLHNLTSVPREQRAHLTTGQLMARIDGVVRAHPEEEVWSVLQRMDEQNVNQVPVMDGGIFLGMITREGLLHHIRVRTELAV